MLNVLKLVFDCRIEQLDVDASVERRVKITHALVMEDAHYLGHYSTT